jgi:hypothetical protein
MDALAHTFDESGPKRSARLEMLTLDPWIIAPGGWAILLP